MSDSFGFYRAGPAVRSDGRPDFSLLLPSLLIGEYPRASDADWLRTVHGVTSVVCLQDEADLASKALVLADLRAAYMAAAVSFHRIPVPDGDLVEFARQLGGIVRLIHDLVSTGERVYVHCNAGMNRAPTVAIAYLHSHCGFALEEARNFVKQRRPCVPYMTLLESHYSERGD